MPYNRISPRSAISNARQGQNAERMVAYISELGRLEGIAKRSSWDGFAVAITATARGREKLTSTLTWLGNRDELGFDEDRRNERIVPRISQVILSMGGGTEHVARITDLSISGAAVRHRPYCRLDARSASVKRPPRTSG